MNVARQLPLLIAILAVAGAVGFVGLQIADAASGPGGPVEPVWDRDVCAHCRMHLSEPAFATQVQTAAGDVLYFDDPGCAFEWMESNDAVVQATWFRHHREDRWLPADNTAFVEVSQSPMGYGFGATEKGTPGAIPLPEARDRMLGEEKQG